MSTSSRRTDVLVLGAHPPALIGVRDHLGKPMRGSMFGLEVTAKVCGVGMGVAGALTAKRLVNLNPRAAVLVGTAGLYPGAEGFRPLDVVVADEVRLLDHAAVARRGTFPGPMQVQVPAPASMAAGLVGDGHIRVHRVRVASPLAETGDAAMGQLVPGALGCIAESLEAFAFAQACTLLNVPFAIVLGVTHVVGPNAMSDWHRYHRDGARQAANTIREWLKIGAPGIPHRQG